MSSLRGPRGKSSCANSTRGSCITRWRGLVCRRIQQRRLSAMLRATLSRMNSTFARSSLLRSGSAQDPLDHLRLQRGARLNARIPLRHSRGQNERARLTGVIGRLSPVQREDGQRARQHHGQRLEVALPLHPRLALLAEIARLPTESGLDRVPALGAKVCLVKNDLHLARS